MCVLIALAYLFLQDFHAACIRQLERAAARLAGVLLTAGGTHGHPLQSGRCIESLQMTMVRVMRFYSLVPGSSADPLTYFATVQ